MKTGSSQGLNGKHILVLQLLLFLVILTAPNIIEAGFLGPRTHVTVINCLQPATDLTVHCKSKDDDLGLRILSSGGCFSFSFRPNFWGTTLFFCSMEWNFSTLKHFDIYDDNRDYEFNDNNWNISAGGPCMFNWYTNKFDICYPWN